MLKKVLFISFILICSFVKAQTADSSAKTTSPPTSKTSSKSEKTQSEPPALGDVFKPKISLGAGMLSFHGDLYSKHYQAPWTARIGYDLNISQRLFKPLQLNFNVLFGKLGANEWINNRQENFQSEIRSGGLSLLYDFGNFIPDRCRIRPWVSVGVNSFEFLSKTDRKDKNGNTYYYWSDGSIKNIDESAPTASLAVNLNRDYVYETDIRESNKDGFGKYQERAWAFPVGAGALMKVTDRVDLKIGFQYYFTTTDYIDGITNKSIGTRSGTRQKDNFVYTSFALQYDLVLKKKSKIDTLPDNYFDGIDWLAIDNGDYDEDGVKDWDDKCHGTPKGVKVDAMGCPFDDDNDGVPNHADDELASPAGVEVNMKGVALTDDYWQNWYNQYMDSGAVVKTEILNNVYAVKKDSATADVAKNENQYTVELARYSGPVPNDEMAYLLSVGDVKSTILPDNTTVLYTAGTYKEIQNAVKRRDVIRAEGNKNAKVGYFKNGDLVTLSDDEINNLVEASKKASELANSTGTNSAGTSGGTNDGFGASDENEFAKGDIVYRVQLGAYKNRISKEVFRNAGTVLELKTDDNVYRYATKGYKTIEGAANAKADLVLEGYGDAFITAYKDGKRIPMNTTKATMETTEKEDITKIESFSSVDKSLVSFKIQLGALRKAGSNDMEEKIKDIEGIEKQGTGSGMIRYTSGTFSDYSKADKYRQELADKGFVEAFVIAVFKGEIISIQEAQELLK
ncbi:MAG: SPOR domain-containing protein [Bacteroidetes bacterium]|nr:SPOR domain-containing protein [Bacteroidota bacterium]